MTLAPSFVGINTFDVWRSVWRNTKLVPLYALGGVDAVAFEYRVDEHPDRYVRITADLLAHWRRVEPYLTAHPHVAYTVNHDGWVTITDDDWRVHYLLSTKEVER